MQSFAYDTDELELIWDAASINEAKKKNRDALFMDISLVNNMPKFKIIDHGYNYSKSQFMLQEEGFTLPQGNYKFMLVMVSYGHTCSWEAGSSRQNMKNSARLADFS